MREFEKSKLYDYLMSLPLQAFYAWGVWEIGQDVTRRHQVLMAGGDPFGWLAITAQILTALFLGVLVAMLILRRAPCAKASGIMPRFAALMGTAASIAYSIFPVVDLSLPVALFTMALVIGGTFTTVIVAFWLGRQFSIMPEARKLVTAGPYALVRHPLYFCEEIALFGIALQHLQPWALILFAAQFTFQLVRMQYEERVLTSAFPEYREYAARTARLIPGVY